MGKSIYNGGRMVGNGAAHRLVRLRHVDSNFKRTGRVRFAGGLHITQLRGDICTVGAT
jgi:hypothetical protein